MVEYIYDAWGNILNTTDNSGINLSEVNPYRYRGYRYDVETDLYYLNSRYYNPEIGRFINVDGLIGATGDILGHNMYAYGMNNPVMMVDPSGYLPKWLKKTITIAAIVIVTTVAVAYVPVVVPALVITAIVKMPGKEEHYNRNQYNNNLPENETEAIKAGWKKELANYHNNNQKDGSNIKYVNKDGREVIYYNNGEIINDTPEDEGTFNFAHPKKDPIGHFFEDMLPYYIWKNSEDDSTLLYDRLFGN